MDIASNLPFVLKFNDFQCSAFSKTEEVIYSDTFSTIKIFENQEVDILFDSLDSQARLYLDALDVLPEGANVLVDDEGHVYRSINHSPLPLYKHSNEYDSLRVDAFRICVVCNDIKYFSLLEVLPKQLTENEWSMMRDDLEEEIRGLAQDIVRRNIGLGTEKEGAIPPQKLYTFLVIKKYAPKVLASLIALQNSPKYRIVTEYVEKDSSKAVDMDSVTVRKYLHRGGAESTYSVPVKTISYDIQENRLLKRIISIYDSELTQFIEMIEGIVSYRKKAHIREHRQYQQLYEQGLSEFLSTAKKLRKITSIIKTQDWYQTVSQLNDGFIPHAFALDSRYGILYKMYEDLRNPIFKVHLDPNYSFSWKKSSSLYEMWCYVKVCRAFAEKYDIVGDFWRLEFSNNLLFPYLANGVKMSFEDENVLIDVIFDQFVPTKENKCKMHEHPFYTVGKHSRPDITIDIYAKKNDWYLGSIILECKYRKLSSFWQQGATDWSSIPQFKAYYTDAKSSFTFDGLGGLLDARPIHQVIVLTPDALADGKGSQAINTLVKTFKPDVANETLISVMQTIELGIISRLEKCKLVEKWRGHSN